MKSLEQTIYLTKHKVNDTDLFFDTLDIHTVPEFTNVYVNKNDIVIFEKTDSAGTSNFSIHIQNSFTVYLLIEIKNILNGNDETK